MVGLVLTKQAIRSFPDKKSELAQIVSLCSCIIVFYQTQGQNVSSSPLQYETPNVIMLMQHVGEVNSKFIRYFKLSESMILVSLNSLWGEE